MKHARSYDHCRSSQELPCASLSKPWLSGQSADADYVADTGGAPCISTVIVQYCGLWRVATMECSQELAGLASRLGFDRRRRVCSPA